jgi:signal transduction histidine kinase
MKAKASRFHSLRWRITLAMFGLAALGSAIYAASVYLAAERLEQSVLNSHVRAEFETLARRARTEPDLRTVRSALLVGYVGDDNPDLPKEFATLAPGGYHAVPLSGRAYQVYVGEDHGRRLYVGYDITEWEALERPVINVLIAGVALGTVLALALGLWISRQVIAPVTALSTKLKSLDPRERSVRIAADFSGEMSVIAEAFDRYMERLDGFVEREQLFTAAAAHELRTPLAVIQGATEVLAEQPNLPPAAGRATARLERAVRDMREFIEALLFLSREERRDEAEQARSELRRIVTQLADDYRALAKGKPLAITVSAPSEVWVDAPPALPAIVVGNLLRNAIEHTAQGDIRVTIEDRTLRIADTGTGIAVEDQARLFARSFSTKPGGGMGLHLTKRICDRFGWQIALESEPGTGTTASVRF